MNQFFLKIIVVSALFFLSDNLNAQSNPRLRSSVASTAKDTLDIDLAITNFRVGMRNDGTYELHRFSDGTKINAVCQGRKVIKLIVLDPNNTPIVPQTMMKTSSKRGCLIKPSPYNPNGSVIKGDCRKGNMDLF